MVDTAAWLVDRVIPEVPVRQWVLSLPYRVRHVCAYDAGACAAVRRILVRAVSGYYERRARRLGKSRPRAFAVAFVQRFDSALRVNLHYHVLWTDGVFAHELREGHRGVLRARRSDGCGGVTGARSNVLIQEAFPTLSPAWRNWWR